MLISECPSFPREKILFSIMIFVYISPSKGEAVKCATRFRFQFSYLHSSCPVVVNLFRIFMMISVKIINASCHHDISMFYSLCLRMSWNRCCLLFENKSLLQTLTRFGFYQMYNFCFNANNTSWGINIWLLSAMRRCLFSLIFLSSPKDLKKVIIENISFVVMPVLCHVCFALN